MSEDAIEIAGHKFATLVAVTPQEHETGLMWKKWPPPIMVFPYNNASIRKFWMKNTLSPLDILFCRGNKIIDICYGEPMSTKLIGPNVPTDLVIELPHGTAQTYGIRAGADVKLLFSTKTIARDINNTIKQILK